VGLSTIRRQTLLTLIFIIQKNREVTAKSISNGGILTKVVFWGRKRDGEEC
jgi:hypothetical protein